MQPRSRWLIELSLLALLSVLVVYPLGMLTLGSLWSGSRPTSPGSLYLGNYGQLFSSPWLIDAAWTTVLFAVGSTAVAVVLGTALAWLAVRTDIPGRPALELATIFPMFMNPMLTATAWALLLSPDIGILNRVLAYAHLGPINIFSRFGMIWVGGLFFVPYVFLLVSASLRRMESAIEEASLITGASPWHTLRRITIPMVTPAIISGTLLTLVTGLEQFAIPAVIGQPAGLYTLTTRLYSFVASYPSRYNTAAATGLVLVVITICLVWLQATYTSRGRSYTTVTGKPGRQRVTPLRRGRVPALLFYLAYLTVSIALPLATLLYSSLRPYVDTDITLSGLSLSIYRSLLVGERAILFWPALKNSLLISTAAATGGVLLGLMVGWISVRFRGVRPALIQQVASVPIALPGIAFAVGMVWAWVRVPNFIYGTVWMLVLAYVVRFLPQASRGVMAAVMQISEHLEEASQACGASTLYTVRRVITPLLRPALLSSWIFVFALSVRELSTAVLLVTPGSQVLSTVVYNVSDNGDYSTLSALVILQAVFVTLIVGLARYLLGLKPLEGS